MSTGAQPAGGGQFAAAVEALWVQQAPVVAQRLAVLEEFASGDETKREEARVVAHKLAGALGSYGRHRGSELSRELETRIEAGEDGRALRPLVDELAHAIS